MRFGKAAAKSREAVAEELARQLPSVDISKPVQESKPGAGLLLELADGEADPPAPASARVEVEHCTVRNWGGRHENEDRVMSLAASLLDSNLGIHTVGILDGHDTETASDLVSRELPKEILRQLHLGISVVEAYTRSLAAMEEKLRSHTSSAGTCCLSCLIAGRFLWCSNLGDCRAILVPLGVPDPAAVASTSGAKASSPAAGASAAKAPSPKVIGFTWMSQDHKASSPSEKTRIEKAGGQVYDGRVEGLEPSRTLGDFDVKLQVSKEVISIVPEVRRHEFVPVGENPAQGVLICATDGVWDVLTGQDVVNLVVARKDICKLQIDLASGSQSPDRKVLKLLAEDLVQFSIAKGSRDDCTAIVTMISVPATRSL